MLLKVEMHLILDLCKTGKWCVFEFDYLGTFFFYKTFKYSLYLEFEIDKRSHLYTRPSLLNPCNFKLISSQCFFDYLVVKLFI